MREMEKRTIDERKLSEAFGGVVRGVRVCLCAPKGAGRAGDTCPPLPSSTASPKKGAAVGDKIILYIHGGAFVLCNHSTHRLITYELVRRTGAVVLAPEYTRPPAAAYPVALDEMVSVYRKVVGFYDPANVIVAGSAIFKSADPKATIESLRKVCIDHASG